MALPWGVSRLPRGACPGASPTGRRACTNASVREWASRLLRWRLGRPRGACRSPVVGSSPPDMAARPPFHEGGPTPRPAPAPSSDLGAAALRALRLHHFFEEIEAQRTTVDVARHPCPAIRVFGDSDGIEAQSIHFNPRINSFEYGLPAAPAQFSHITNHPDAFIRGLPEETKALDAARVVRRTQSRRAVRPWFAARLKDRRIENERTLARSRESRQDARALARPRPASPILRMRACGAVLTQVAQVLRTPAYSNHPKGLEVRQPGRTARRVHDARRARWLQLRIGRHPSEGRRVAPPHERVQPPQAKVDAGGRSF